MILPHAHAIAPPQSLESAPANFPGNFRTVLETLRAHENTCQPAASPDVLTDLFDATFNPLGSSETSIFDFYRTRRCSELFSTEPPGVIQALSPYLNSQERRTLQEGWNPLIGWNIMHLVRRRNTGNLMSTIRDAIGFIEIHDACTAVEQRPLVDRNAAPLARIASPFAVRSNEGARPQQGSSDLLSSDERGAILAQFLEVRSQTAQMCCGGNSLCRRIIEFTPLRFCPLNESRTATTTSCPSSGIGMRLFATDEILAQFLDLVQPGWRSHAMNFETFNAHRNELRFPNPPTVWVVPFRRVEGQGLVFESRQIRNTLRHELGHVCSVAWMLGESFQPMRAGDSIHRRMALTLLERQIISINAPDKCAFDDNRQITYAQMFQGIGLSPATVRCLIQSVERFPRQRINHHECDNVCRGLQIEETLAQIWPIVTGNNPADLRALISIMAGDIRDTEHPLTGDLVACLLHTDSMRRRLEQATMCRQ